MQGKTKQQAKHRIQRQSLPEALAESLRERILSGEFEEGAPLVQEAIAAEYDCSRMPVREAFRQLEAAGLIVSKIHKGSVVTKLTPSQIKELFELRALLECDVLAQSLGQLTDESLANSEQILEELEKTYLARDISKVGALNWEFHRSLYLPSGRLQTLTILQGINVQIDRYIRIQLVLSSEFERAQRDHRVILALCREHDQEVISYMREHILHTGNELLEALNRHRAGESKLRSGPINMLDRAVAA